MVRPARRQPSQSQKPANGRSQRVGPARSQANRRARVESEDEAEENQMDVDAEDSELEAENVEGDGGAGVNHFNETSLHGSQRLS